MFIAPPTGGFSSSGGFNSTRILSTLGLGEGDFSLLKSETGVVNWPNREFTGVKLIMKDNRMTAVRTKLPLPVIKSVRFEEVSADAPNGPLIAAAVLAITLLVRHALG
ncbi:uncharacterized protein LOC126795085 isoform X4 [Argentina anserina]|nr:uncharacterized protein LOC126795085 isoform X2 [Potentilla anserina]XP_050377866.1 uncharacterized protein LOC126795085 isoform X3 [Potentilla anserina]XP_050377867.1 uncharacterized protein LOC126795085 isoform X4 [Potentilla anserina]